MHSHRRRCPRHTPGLSSSDYMLHSEAGTESIRMVEVNTISCAFAGLAGTTSDLHRFIAAQHLPLAKVQAVAAPATAQAPRAEQPAPQQAAPAQASAQMSDDQFEAAVAQAIKDGNSAAAAAATDAAIAAAAAAVADHQPPAAPSVVAAGAVTAAAVDVASMSSAERRELLAKLGGFMGDE